MANPLFYRDQLYMKIGIAFSKKSTRPLYDLRRGASVSYSGSPGVLPRLLDHVIVLNEAHADVFLVPDDRTGRASARDSRLPRVPLSFSDSDRQPVPDRLHDNRNRDSRSSQREQKSAKKRPIAHYLTDVVNLGCYAARGKAPPLGNMVFCRGLARLTDIHLGFEL